MIDAGAEALRRPEDRAAAWSNAVTFSFGDPAASVFGLVRLGLSGPEARSGSALSLLFAGEGDALARADRVELDEPSAWERIELAGARAEIEDPLARWRVGLDHDAAQLDLRFTAGSPPVELPADSAAGRAGGVQGYEQLCRVEGTVTVDGAPQRIECLGQRGHGWGAPDWERIEAARSVSVWLEDGDWVALSAIRPAGSESHANEALTAFLVEDSEDGPAVREVLEPRLSTTYDAEGRQTRAGLELWLTDEEDALPRRVAGEALRGTTLDLGELRLQCAFFGWRMEGRSGVGRYDVLRRG